MYDPADLDHAFGLVVSELDGPAEVARRLHTVRAEFLRLLGNRYALGKWVVQTLEGLDWDWPRWHASGYVTLPELRAEAGGMKAVDGLSMLTVPQLKALLREHGGQAHSKATKADVLRAVCALPSEIWEPIAHDQVQQRLETKMMACRREMGARMGSRISHIALQRWRLRQLTSPEHLALFPRWEFMCPSDGPKSCKRLNGKVLPVEQALKAFPALPCARLNCCCWLAARSHRAGTAAQAAGAAG